VLRREKRKAQIDYVRKPKEPPHYKSKWLSGEYYDNPLDWCKEESKYLQKMEIFKAKKTKYKNFTMEKPKESTPKKHKLKDEPYKHENEGKTAIIENDKENKENATLTKARKQNGTVTNSLKN
jgi:hypothetical protein